MLDVIYIFADAWMERIEPRYALFVFSGHIEKAPFELHLQVILL
jgi:hypothetical protein